MNDKTLKEIWDKSLNQAKQDLEEDGVNNIIATISGIISQCQRMGMDIKLQEIQWANGHGFKYSGDDAGTVPLTGIIKIMNAEHFFCYGTKKGDTPCSKLFLSMHDHRYNTSEFRSFVFDLEEDFTENFNDFQKKLIYMHCRMQVLQDCDIENVSEYKRDNAKYLKAQKTSKSMPGL